jgi:hypothetical protein
MWAFIVAIIVFGLTLVISILVLFRYGMSDNQSSKHSSRNNVHCRNADRIRYRRIALAAAARMVMRWLARMSNDSPHLRQHEQADR